MVKTLLGRDGVNLDKQDIYGQTPRSFVQVVVVQGCPHYSSQASATRSTAKAARALIPSPLSTTDSLYGISPMTAKGPVPCPYQ